MTKALSLSRALMAAGALTLLLPACGDDDTQPNPPTSGDGDATGDGDGDTGGDGDGDPTFVVTIENTGTAFSFPQSGVFNTPVGANEPGPIGPGGSYEFTFFANPGHSLTFATMFIPSNDFFYAPDGDGIALFDDQDMPITGDITAQLALWDSGTEVDQEPGVGADQPQRSAGTGAADANTNVRLAADTFDNLPDLTDVIEATLAVTEVNGAYQFTVTIANVSDGTTLNGDQAVPLSPGSFAIHTAPNPMFEVGAPDFGQGLEVIAEDGNPMDLTANLAADTGGTFLASPGVWAVTQTANVLFVPGQADLGAGLEAIAEDGSPGELATSLEGNADVSASGVFNTPVGADGPGPLPPGMSYSFEFDATPGDLLTLSGMLVPSNDWVFAEMGGAGIALFDDAGEPITGDVTAQIGIYDVGTEVNQELGFGVDQVQNQSGPDTGAVDADTTVRMISFDHDFTITIELAE